LTRNDVSIIKVGIYVRKNEYLSDVREEQL